jgi:hypothetical protein
MPLNRAQAMRVINISDLFIIKAFCKSVQMSNQGQRQSLPLISDGERAIF